MWRITNQPSKSTCGSDSALHLVVLLAGNLYLGLQVMPSFSILGRILKGPNCVWRSSKASIMNIGGCSMWPVVWCVAHIHLKRIANFLKVLNFQLVVSQTQTVHLWSAVASALTVHWCLVNSNMYNLFAIRLPLQTRLSHQLCKLPWVKTISQILLSMFIHVYNNHKKIKHNVCIVFPL